MLLASQRNHRNAQRSEAKFCPRLPACRVTGASLPDSNSRYDEGLWGADFTPIWKARQKSFHFASGSEVVVKRCGKALRPVQLKSLSAFCFNPRESWDVSNTARLDFAAYLERKMKGRRDLWFSGKIRSQERWRSEKLSEGFHRISSEFSFLGLIGERIGCFYRNFCLTFASSRKEWKNKEKRQISRLLRCEFPHWQVASCGQRLLHHNFRKQSWVPTSRPQTCMRFVCISKNRKNYKMRELFQSDW